ASVTDRDLRLLLCSVAALPSVRTRRSSELVGDLVEIALGDAALEAGAVHVHDEADAVVEGDGEQLRAAHATAAAGAGDVAGEGRSEEHTAELQSSENLVCRLLLATKRDQIM